MRLKWKVGREFEVFSATQPVSYSLPCQVSFKVKYFGRVANA